jgi:hypothetical protein
MHASGVPEAIRVREGSFAMFLHPSGVPTGRDALRSGGVALRARPPATRLHASGVQSKAVVIASPSPHDLLIAKARKTAQRSASHNQRGIEGLVDARKRHALIPLRLRLE